MRVLFISSSSMMATHLAYLMKKEGHHVKLFIDDPDRNESFDGLVEKTKHWKKELKWVGKGPNSLIVFDDIGYGKIQDKLRKEGYSVFGGSAAADRLEADRVFGQKVFEQCGMKIVPIKNFKDAASAIRFLKKNKGAWVIKQNGHSSKALNYVGHFDDGRDVLNQLESYRKHHGGVATITLQQKIHGVEFACARYFNGTDWVGPIEMNVEHKKMFTDDLGPTTSEMGTLGWYDDNEDNRLFQETLGKMKPYLQKIQYKGDIDINVIITETGVYPLEATPRFGSPMIYLHAELHKSPWGQFMKAIADGKPYDLKWKKGYGIVLLLAAPPFPYAKKLKELTPKGVDVYLDPALNDLEHVYFEGVAARKLKGKNHYYIADHQGYVAYVTAVGKTVNEARAKSLKLAKRIYFSKMFYRNDIGVSFIETIHDRLCRWGYM